MFEGLKDKICRINCMTEEIDSLYHQAAVKLGVSDSVLFVLYMTYINDGQCLLYDICRLSGISKQTINSAIRKLEYEDILYLEKQDGKSKMVHLTEKGKVYAGQTAAKLYKAEYNAFRDWSVEEVNLYLRLIEKQHDSLRKQIEKI